MFLAPCTKPHTHTQTAIQNISPMFPGSSFWRSWKPRTPNDDKVQMPSSVEKRQNTLNPWAGYTVLKNTCQSWTEYLSFNLSVKKYTHYYCLVVWILPNDNAYFYWKGSRRDWILPRKMNFGRLLIGHFCLPSGDRWEKLHLDKNFCSMWGSGLGNRAGVLRFQLMLWRNGTALPFVRSQK